MELPNGIGAALAAALTKQQAAEAAAKQAAAEVRAAEKAAQAACFEVAHAIVKGWPRVAVEAVTKELCRLLDWRIE